MLVTIESFNSEALLYRDYKNKCEISIDGNPIFNVFDGEPEDNDLSRNFNDVWLIDKLLEKAYLAGKNGESLKIEKVLVDEER